MNWYIFLSVQQLRQIATLKHKLRWAAGLWNTFQAKIPLVEPVSKMKQSCNGFERKISIINWYIPVFQMELNDLKRGGGSFWRHSTVHLKVAIFGEINADSDRRPTRPTMNHSLLHYLWLKILKIQWTIVIYLNYLIIQILIILNSPPAWDGRVSTACRQPTSPQRHRPLQIPV